MSPLAWLGLGLGMTAYALATFWGWHLGPKLQQRPWVRSQLLLLTCGIWLELVFFDLLPSTQPTLTASLRLAAQSPGFTDPDWTKPSSIRKVFLRRPASHVE